MFSDLYLDRLILKCIDYDDVEFIYKEFSTDEVNKYLYDEEPFSSIEEAKSLIDFYKEEPRNQHRWIIILKENGEKIGTCGFHCWNKKEGTVEVGYDLQPEYWQKGYMTEALNAILKFATDEMKAKGVLANIYDGNIASEKTALKCGFVKTERKYYEEFRGKKYLHYTYEYKN